MYNEYDIFTDDDKLIYYKVWCDDATDGDKTDISFDLYEFDRMIEWLNHCKKNNWDYQVFVEVWNELEEYGEHIADLNFDFILNKQKRSSK